MRQSLPPGPRYPSGVQLLGFWTRPLPFLERMREHYGRRFTVKLVGTPPIVHHTDPEHVKEIYTAPPDVLYPGVGAQILEPVVGRNSVILLDEAAHMEQRKLMLPAFHGEKMEALTDLITEVAERDVAGGHREQGKAAATPRDRAASAHPGADARDHPAGRLRPRSWSATRRDPREPLRHAGIRRQPAQPARRATRVVAPFWERLPMTAGFFEPVTGSPTCSTSSSTSAVPTRAIAATCWRCCSRRGTRTARRCRARSSATSS